MDAFTVTAGAAAISSLIALDRHFPGMKERYIKRYGNAYELPSPEAGELKQLPVVFTVVS